MTSGGCHTQRGVCAGAAAAAVVTGVLLAGCSSLPSLTGNSSPFASSSLLERTFIAAAQTWDFDKDGVVTCQEWQTYVTGLFRDADGDGNGSLDATEFKRLSQTDRLFEVADVSFFDMNNDGRVTLEELTGKPNPAFKLLDKNGDCRIERNESVQVVPVDAPPPAKEPDPNPTGGAGRPY